MCNKLIRSFFFLSLAAYVNPTEIKRTVLPRLSVHLNDLVYRDEYWWDFTKPVTCEIVIIDTRHKFEDTMFIMQIRIWMKIHEFASDIFYICDLLSVLYFGSQRGSSKFRNAENYDLKHRNEIFTIFLVRPTSTNLSGKSLCENIETSGSFKSSVVESIPNGESETGIRYRWDKVSRG